MEKDIELIVSALVSGQSKVTVGGVVVYLNSYKYRPSQGRTVAKNIATDIFYAMYTGVVYKPKKIASKPRKKLTGGKVINGIRYYI